MINTGDTVLIVLRVQFINQLAVCAHTHVCVVHTVRRFKRI